jgi:hypothetical protein
MGFTNSLTPAEIDRHRATWELRQAATDGRDYTDAEFAELLVRVGVPDAAEQLHAARRFIYRHQPDR